MDRPNKIENISEIFEELATDSADIFPFFVDLCGSTEYKQNLRENGLPDVIWISRQLIFLQRTAKIVKRRGGIIVKTIGDEVFAYFDFYANPNIVVKTGIEIIQGFENLSSFKDKSEIRARVSIDFGTTFNGSLDEKVSFDPISTPVDRCARLNKKAKENDLIISSDFYELLCQSSSAKEVEKTYGFVRESVMLPGIGAQDYYLLSAS
jgi:class 3 adenylate cyclase